MTSQNEKIPQKENNRNSVSFDKKKLFTVLSPILSFLLALIVGAIPIILYHVNPILAYKELIIGAFGSSFGFSETIIKAIPLVLSGLGYAFAARSGLFNIGCEGQIYIGALGATLVGLYLGDLPPIVGIPLCIFASAIFGGIWAGIPGFLKARLGVSEVITTIMFNYIGINVISYMVRGPLVEPPGYFPETPKINESFWYVNLFGSRIHSGIFIALLLLIVVYFILWHTPFGFRIRAVGLSQDASEYIGIRVRWNLALAMAISGALAGIAGANEVLGIQHRLIEAFSPGYGYDAIAVSLLGQNHPLGIVFSSILFSGLRAGAGAMQRAVGIPDAIIKTIQGLVLIFVVAGSMLPKYLERRQKKIQDS